MIPYKIAIAFPTGPCFGVERALKITYKILDEKKSVYMLHPLIHNPRVIGELEKKGVKVVSPEEIPPNSYVILSAHGTPVSVKKLVESKTNNVVDAVCPLVEHLHSRALELLQEDRFLIIAADPHHQETRALVSILPKDRYALWGEWEKIPMNVPLGVVFQTTFEYKKVPQVIEKLYTISDDIRIVNTICPATRGRQGVIERVAGDYELIIVVGGKNSANTGRLYEKAKRYADAIWIEDKNEIDVAKIRGYRSYLIVGGASTPIEHLIEVYLHFKKMIQ